MARPYEKLPTGAKTHLEAMASNGLLSESAAATALGMPLDQFRKVVKEHEKSKQVWENALAIERDNLLQALYDKAAGGDTKAAQTLLAVRHGMTEKQPQAAGDRVNINFTLPAPMDAEAYARTLQPIVERLPDDSPTS